MSAPKPFLYRVGHGLLRASLACYFSRIERFHAERVPLTGPVLFTSNHPNSLTDAFVIGTSVPRKVNFVATVQLFRWLAVAVVGAPVALYGWLHRLIPCWAVQWVVQQTAKRPVDHTHVSTATILGGLVIFTAFYTLCALVFYRFFGLHAAALYALSLPPASLAAHCYGRELRRFAASLRAASVLLQAPAAVGKLLAARAELISLIDAERHDYLLAKAAKKGD
jgi:hypothetical protein